jgi:hypothetical protein
MNDEPFVIRLFFQRECQYGAGTVQHHYNLLGKELKISEKNMNLPWTIPAGR